MIPRNSPALKVAALGIVFLVLSLISLYYMLKELYVPGLK